METGRLGKIMDTLISREEFDEYSQNQETKCVTLERELLSKIDENLESTRKTLNDFKQSKTNSTTDGTGSDVNRPEVKSADEILSKIPTPDDVLLIVQSEIQKIWPIVDEIIVNAAIETKEKGMP